MTIKMYDGKKAVTVGGDEGWSFLFIDEDENDINKLYSTVAWLYRCVDIRSNAVAAMPYEVRKNKNTILTYDGSTFSEDLPRDLEFLFNFPILMKRTETAACLTGRAYWEKRQMLSGRAYQHDWLIPSSITPILNGVVGLGGARYDASKVYGDLLGFWRQNPMSLAEFLEMEIEQVIYFWLPDYAVEIGPAMNYPGKAVLENAGVIGAMDMFLHGYFDRGMIKATLLKYKNNISNDEASRLKEWWQRVANGIKNVWSTIVLRGDFEVMTIGEGIKDLRDNALSADEKKDIAVGMGIPLSKVDSTASTDSNREADDRQFIEDTIIPEITWIFQCLNQQVFNPLGYSLVAMPQQMRVMQTDERLRSGAFMNYVNSGIPVEVALDMLGINVPEEHLQAMQDEKEQRREMAIAISGNTQQKPVATDSEDDSQEDDEGMKFIQLLDKRDEMNQFKRWLKNRNYKAIDVSEFNTEFLTIKDKINIAISEIRKSTTYKVSSIDNVTKRYGNQLAKFIDSAIRENMPVSDFSSGMSAVVRGGLLDVFKQSIGISQDDDLNPNEQEKFIELVNDQLVAVRRFTTEIFEGEKATRFERVKETLQGLGSNLGGRLQMWTNAARLFWNNGKIFGRNEVSLEWRIGATENHCADCLRYHGQIKSQSEWQQLASILIYPQSRALDCKGFNCDCGVYEI